MKVVLDTNVIVSGLLSPYGAPAEIMRMAASGDLEVCYDVRILTEYRNVLLRPKFHFERKYIDSLIEQIKTCGHIAQTEPLKEGLTDPTDEPFLEAALSERVRCLVTGNPRHYPSKKRQGVPILSPMEFLEFYRRKM